MGLLSTVHEKLVVKSVDENGVRREVEFLDNDSIRPMRVKDRTWTQTTYLAFWFSATANVSNLYAASTGMTVGLSMWEAIACQTAGQFVAGCLMALNGRGGAMYRVPYPVLCRSSFGPWGALWPTANRAIMSIVWNGVNTVQGAQCLYVMLHAIFPSIANIPDGMGSKSALNTAGMICFLVYWILNCAFLLIPVPKMKIYVYIKVAIFYAGAIAMLAWTVSLAGGSTHTLRQSSKIEGTEKSWTILKFIFLGTAACGTFIANAADLQRYTRKPDDVLWGQIISFPLSNLLVSVFGCVIAAASESVFGELEWNPVLFLDRLMEGERYTAGNRAACFFIALALVYSSIFSSIFENSIPAGNDIASLLPKYITIKRGFFICAVLSFAICPWYLLSTASVFINFLSSYQIFLSAIAGILICDYYLIRRGKLRIPDLYTMNPEAKYHFLGGWNLRAFAVYIIAVAPNFYGFLNQMGVKAPVSIQRYYYVAYPTGLIIAFLCYTAICYVLPVEGMEKSRGWKEPKDYVDVFDPARDQIPQIEGQGVGGDESDGLDGTERVAAGEKTKNEWA